MPAALQITTRTPSSSQVEPRHIAEWSGTATVGWWRLYQNLIKEDMLMAVVVIARMGRRYFKHF